MPSVCSKQGEFQSVSLHFQSGAQVVRLMVGDGGEFIQCSHCLPLQCSSLFFKLRHTGRITLQRFQYHNLIFVQIAK